MLDFSTEGAKHKLGLRWFLDFFLISNMRPRFLCIFLCLEHKLDELELLFTGSLQKRKKFTNFDCSGKKCSLNTQRSLEEVLWIIVCYLKFMPLTVLLFQNTFTTYKNWPTAGIFFPFIPALKCTFFLLYLHSVLCLSLPIFFLFLPLSTLCQSDFFFCNLN